jgi:hypothetical protein
MGRVRTKYTSGMCEVEEDSGLVYEIDSARPYSVCKLISSYYVHREH